MCELMLLEDKQRRDLSSIPPQALKLSSVHRFYSLSTHAVLLSVCLSICLEKIRAEVMQESTWKLFLDD